VTGHLKAHSFDHSLLSCSLLSFIEHRRFNDPFPWVTLSRIEHSTSLGFSFTKLSAFTFIMNNEIGKTPGEQITFHLPAAEIAKIRRLATPKSQITMVKSNAGAGRPKVKLIIPTVKLRSCLVKLSVNSNSLRRLEETGSIFVKGTKRTASQEQPGEATLPPAKVAKHVRFALPDAPPSLTSPNVLHEFPGGVEADFIADINDNDEEGAARKQWKNKGSARGEPAGLHDVDDDDSLPAFGDNHIPKRYEAIRLREVQRHVKELEAKYQGLPT
jgi:hypothetical protein